MRDSNRDRQHFTELIEAVEADLGKVFEEAERAVDARHRAAWLESGYLAPMLQLLGLKYSRGDGLEEIAGLLPRTLEALSVATAAFKQDRQSFPENPINLRFGGPFRNALVLLGYAACLAPDVQLLRRLLAEIEPGNALFDGLARRFDPDRPHTDNLAGEYDQKWFLQCWGPLVELFSLAAAERPAALKSYLKGWYGKMRIFPWYGSEKKWSYSGYWCVEAALAVAALDIDDSTFRDHKYYPADLVAYYRAHVRHSRDAWRAPEPAAG